MSDGPTTVRNRALFADPWLAGSRSIPGLCSYHLVMLSIYHSALQLSLNTYRLYRQLDDSGRNVRAWFRRGAMGDTTAQFRHTSSSMAVDRSRFEAIKSPGLGPRDSFGNPYGGNVLVASQLELIIPRAGEVQKPGSGQYFL